jgi:hypothetical protein
VIRCFGLNIQLDNDETIIAVECLSDDYYLNPQKFSYDGVTPDFGSTPCLCNSDDGLLPGLDSNGITIAMCSLYADDDPDHNVPPATSGGLVRITVSGEACITITENGKLGGVLDEDNVDIDPTLPNDPCVCVDLPEPTCLQEAASEFAEWQAWGEPNCWCYQYQCRGDVDGLKIGFWRVNAADLTAFRAAFFLMDGPLAALPDGICSDLDHLKVGFWRVNAADLAEFRTYFFVMDPIPSCDAAPIITGPYNFWLTP